MYFISPRFAKVCVTHLSLWKALLVIGFVFHLVNILLTNRSYEQSMKLCNSLVFKQHHQVDSYITTNISHIVFSIAGSSTALKNRSAYLESWWRPNITKGFLWLNKVPTDQLPWPATLPPFRVSEDTRRFLKYNKFMDLVATRIANSLVETFKEVNQGVRWYIMSDDDTIFLVDNLVEVLARYDHNKYYYIGETSERIYANTIYSFHMGFGGAGYALSSPLAQALVRNFELCMKRYSSLRVGDNILKSCIYDLGVTLTHERGFHQIDLRGDISGMLSAHPPVPFVSFHHLEKIYPIFPSMSRQQSLYHLMKTINIDPSRSLQQSICYHKQSNWTFSVSWGYAAYVYEKVLPPNFLEKPLETFTPWKIPRPHYMFNTRPINKDPCEMPHVFFFDSVEKADGDQFVTSYTRRWPRMLPTCSSSGGHLADLVTKIQVTSPSTRHTWDGRRECCDVVRISGDFIPEIKIRSCMKDEMVS